MDLGTEVITEVEIQPQMEEVEIEAEGLDDDGMGSLVSDDEVMLQSPEEEIVGYDVGLVDNNEILIEPPGPSSSHHHGHGHKRVGAGGRKMFHHNNNGPHGHSNHQHQLMR